MVRAGPLRLERRLRTTSQTPILWRGYTGMSVFRPLKSTRIVPWMRQGRVQIPKGEARSASFSEDYVAAARHMNP